VIGNYIVMVYEVRKIAWCLTLAKPPIPKHHDLIHWVVQGGRQNHTHKQQRSPRQIGPIAVRMH